MLLYPYSSCLSLLFTCLFNCLMIGIMTKTLCMYSCFCLISLNILLTFISIVYILSLHDFVYVYVLTSRLSICNTNPDLSKLLYRLPKTLRHIYCAILSTLLVWHKQKLFPATGYTFPEDQTYPQLHEGAEIDVKCACALFGHLLWRMNSTYFTNLLR